MGKSHPYWEFTSSDGQESWWGDCPKWAESVKRARPELIVTTGRFVGKRQSCTACQLGLTH